MLSISRRASRSPDDHHFLRIRCVNLLHQLLSNASLRPPLKTSVDSTITVIFRQKRAQDQALELSCDGFFSKIHAVCDAYDNSIQFILTGDRSIVRLFNIVKARAILTDKGYDANYVVDAAKAIGTEVVISSKSNRKEELLFGRGLYKERNLIERLFNKIRHLRRIATRYDKTLRLSLICFHDWNLPVN